MLDHAGTLSGLLGREEQIAAAVLKRAIPQWALIATPATTRQLTGKKRRMTPAAAGKGSNKN
jgi:hypothetical protein